MKKSERNLPRQLARADSNDRRFTAVDFGAKSRARSRAVQRLILGLAEFELSIGQRRPAFWETTEMRFLSGNGDAVGII